MKLLSVLLSVAGVSGLIWVCPVGAETALPLSPPNTESSPPSPPTARFDKLAEHQHPPRSNLGGVSYQSPPELASDPASPSGARERASRDLGGNESHNLYFSNNLLLARSFYPLLT